MNRAVFLDRDGVINRKAPEGQYVTCLEEFVFLPEVAEAIAMLNHAEFLVIVVSNQRGIAKGLMTTQDLEVMHQWMLRKLADSGAIVDAIYYCPHDKQPHCACRKPEPGMLLKAADEHHLDMAATWMIGDSDSDMEAGRRAGCRTVRVLRNNATEISNADVVAKSLLDAVQRILHLEVTQGRGAFRDFRTRKPNAALSS